MLHSFGTASKHTITLRSAAASTAAQEAAATQQISIGARKRQLPELFLSSASHSPTTIAAPTAFSHTLTPLPMATLFGTPLDRSSATSDHSAFPLSLPPAPFTDASVIAASPQVADLLISLLYSAVVLRHLPFAQPLDVVSIAGDSRLFRLAKTGAVHFDALMAAVARLPSVAEMAALVQQGPQHFADTMDGQDTRLLPLLRWLFLTAPTIRPLTAAETLPSIPTPHQFLLIHRPDVEERFQRAKQGTSGSAWGFHGSLSSNWHSILRTGLKDGRLATLLLFEVPSLHRLRSLCCLRWSLPLRPSASSVGSAVSDCRAFRVTDCPLSTGGPAVSPLLSRSSVAL